MVKKVGILFGVILLAAVVFFIFKPKEKEEIRTEVPEEVEMEEREEEEELIKIGDTAPDFVARTPDAEELSLKDVLAKNGKITLVEFWASWCPHCQAEMPNVHRVYEKYHDQGLEIIGVSVDANYEDWVQAIDEFSMDWHHVSNLQEWDDPIVERYGVMSIPSNFLLDANGKVVAKQVHGAQLEEALSKLLAE